ncbi:hypothetical protein CBOM_06095 [Ceraceosorus bombacis]|uniref:Uncharacterized protein n=1 Tax=Ceraceosorus bombacis TaxID=401625 RepID=A0A0P1BJA7_9BASI|nr:hypothetical protein CBOM_06095 [Ceraceosorus bombacis]
MSAAQRLPADQAQQAEMQARFVQEQQMSAVDAQTGIEQAPRGTEPIPESQLNPAFDKDDLRQGHPPPAVAKGIRIPKKIKVRRPRALKGKPWEKGEGAENVTADDMTDEEIEMEEDEAEKKPGLIGKILGKS